MARPREFDESQVLDAAAEVFWAKGYNGTTTRDLAECTGLTAASMYNAFDDKRGLYLRALQHYLDSHLGERIGRLETLPSSGDAIVGFFREIIDRSLADPQHRGCMLVNSALEATSDDRILQSFIAAQTVMIESFFFRRIVDGQRTGELPAAPPAEDAARMLLSVVMGLRVLARVRPDAGLLNGLVRPALAMLGLGWPGDKKSARRARRKQAAKGRRK
jgi:TetR/AcrR family transcriptional repressor of nem operon